jgi:hypothetical protein
MEQGIHLMKVNGALMRDCQQVTVGIPRMPHPKKLGPPGTPGTPQSGHLNHGKDHGKIMRQDENPLESGFPTFKQNPSGFV